MLEAETESGDYWAKCGEEALAHNVEGVVIMVSPTECHCALRCFHLVVTKVNH